MKKITMILMIAFTMMTTVFAEVRLLPKDVFDNYLVPAFEYTPSMQPQIAYVADTWEDVYEKTGVGKYGWRSIDSTYCDPTEHRFLLIIKYKENGDLGWICSEYPGDGSETLYVADAY